MSAMNAGASSVGLVDAPATDPLLRRAAIWRRSSARRLRRVLMLLDWVDGHPGSTRDNDPELARLDDLVGDADRLVRSL